MREGNLYIRPQPAPGLTRELMGYAPVKANAAQHARKSSVDKKAVDPGSIAGKKDIEGASRIPGYSGGKGKPVAGPHRNDPDAGIPSF